MPILFDCAVFDLDGTLVATDRFWVQAARSGARRAFAALGLTRELPSAQEWMGLVGKPLEAGFRELFPDLPDGQRTLVQEACVEEEHRLLRAGGASLMPGAEDVLRALRAQGLRLGIASNCSRSYLEHMLERLGLRALVDDALCLDSPGVSCKADMVGALLARFGTRSGIMVGDRSVDRDAAWANGLPHVHCAFGFAGEGEEVRAEGRVLDLPGLLPLLETRGAWIEDALQRAGALRPPCWPRAGEEPRPAVLGVSGAPLAGKSLFARDAARLLRARGRACAVVGLEAFRRPARPAPDALLERPLEALYDVEALERTLLEPHARGDAARVGDDEVAPGDLLLLEGPFLTDPRLAPRLARIVHLALDVERVLLRAAAREGGSGPALAALRGSLLPAWRAFEERYPPSRLADCLVDGSNPLGAAPELARGLQAPRAAD